VAGLGGEGCLSRGAAGDTGRTLVAVVRTALARPLRGRQDPHPPHRRAGHRAPRTCEGGSGLWSVVVVGSGSGVVILIERWRRCVCGIYFNPDRVAARW
jgi:hypothetical protein